MMKSIYTKTAISIFLLSVSAVARAAEYHCVVEKKLDSERTYSQARIEKSKFSVTVEESDAATFLSRCSFVGSVGKVTCDRYEADEVVFDEHTKIKKYYYFPGKFDVQIFPNLSFVENNGRGGIAFGSCTIAKSQR